MRAVFFGALRILLFVPLCASSAFAGACITPPASNEAIAQFKAKPDAVIAEGADTRTIEAIVRDLTATDASLAADFVRLSRQLRQGWLLLAIVKSGCWHPRTSSHSFVVL